MTTIQCASLSTLIMVFGCSESQKDGLGTFQLDDTSIQLDEDTSVDIVLSAEVSNSTELLEYEIVEGPTLGSLVGSGAEWEYTPEENVNGVDSFTWRASAAGEVSESAEVRLLILPVNDAPTASDTRFVTLANTPFVGKLMADDVDRHLLFYALMQTPEFGELDLSQDTFTYTPDLDHVGFVAFEWSATDPEGATTGPVRVTIEVETIDPFIVEDFQNGEVNPTYWAGDPMGDADLSAQFSTSDAFSLRIGDSGGSLTSRDVNFSPCPGPVAWDFRLRPDDPPGQPEADDSLELSVFDPAANTYVDLTVIPGGMSGGFVPVLGNSIDPVFDGPRTHIRLGTPNTGDGITTDSWFVDDLAFGCDNDGDKIPDIVEQSWYGTSRMLADTDGDGILDGDEVLAGTNPDDGVTPRGFYDGFESGATPDAAIWMPFAPPTEIRADGTDYAIGTWSMMQAGGSAITTDLDFSSCTNVAVQFLWNDRDLDFNDDIVVETWDGTQFVNRLTILGNGANNQGFQPFVVRLSEPYGFPADFKVQFRSQVSLSFVDRGYIDDVAVDCDTDVDGLGDYYEEFVSLTDPTNPDSDADGVQDGQEFLNGTDPRDPLSH
ncbi:MAG: Ig-like domain-containing protein [Myxococcota bacterium]